MERAPALPPDENSRHNLFMRAVAPAPSSAPVPRALLVFAHQDDEAVALGARLGNFGSAHIVHVTDGAPRNEQDSSRHGLTLAEYRKARASELAAMLNAAGLGNVSRECLRVPDQEAGLTLVALTRTIDRILRQRRPEVIFTHPYEGGHPDHDACAFAVQHAVELRPESQRPLVIEGTFYHAGPRGLRAGSFPPPPHPIPEAEFRLTAEESRRKQALLDLFTTQRQTLSGFPLEYERFRIAPHYDFCNPPHTPPVLYDNYPWGMTSREFVQLACEAEAMLSNPVPAGACH
jgi:LmbE family N-acetylglucosaminyl deacetylase